MEESQAAKYERHLDTAEVVGLRMTADLSFKKACFVNMQYVQQALTAIYLG